MIYIGSKNKISKYIAPIIQNYTDKSESKIFVDAFVGGANIIDKIKAKTRIGNDIDSLVIDLYNATINNPELLESLPNFVSKEHYYDVRDNPDKYEKWYRSAILLFASYNSRVYGGCYGAFAKTKNGKIRNYYQEAINNYKKQIPNLKNVKFSNLDYKDLKVSDAVIYCDPPYAEGIGYSTKFNHTEFWNWVRENSKNNVILVSEYNAPDDFECIWQQEITIHLNNRNKIIKTEKLFIIKERL